MEPTKTKIHTWAQKTLDFMLSPEGDDFLLEMIRYEFPFDKACMCAIQRSTKVRKPEHIIAIAAEIMKLQERRRSA